MTKRPKLDSLEKLQFRGGDVTQNITVPTKIKIGIKTFEIVQKKLSVTRIAEKKFVYP